MEQIPSNDAPPPSDLRALAIFFLRLGTTAFGGPAAHIALMQEEVVVRRKWLTSQEFLDMLAATNFIPGPNSTEMSIHIGYRRAGWRGLVLAGSCFILPAALMCSFIAALYVHFGQRPISQSMLWGVKPVVIAVIVQALWKLGRIAIKSPLLVVVTAIAIALLFLGVNELMVLFGGGVVVGILETMQRRLKRGPALPLLLPPPLLAAGTTTAAAATTVGVTAAPLLPLFLVFLKIGSVLFGSGYVLLAFLRADFVERYHWLSEQQLLDAVAVGQVTPGPVFTTATFIGYVTSGPLGAAVATFGIFVPAFIFVALSAPLLPRLRNSATLGAFLDGLNVASLALMAFVTWELGKAALFSPAHGMDAVAAALAIAALVAITWGKMNSAWVVLAAALAGVVRAYVLGI